MEALSLLLIIFWVVMTVLWIIIPFIILKMNRKVQRILDILTIDRRL